MSGHSLVFTFLLYAVHCCFGSDQNVPVTEATQQSESIAADLEDSSSFLLFPSYRRGLHQTPIHTHDNRITPLTTGHRFLGRLKNDVVQMEFAVDTEDYPSYFLPRCVLERNGKTVWTRRSCRSPLVFENQIQQEGTYSLFIYGTHGINLGNILASATWIVDRTPTRATITKATSIGSHDKRFVFAANDSMDIDHFQCRVDGGHWYVCWSPETITSSGSGRHKFQVRAVDLAGNVDSEPDVYSWCWSSYSIYPNGDRDYFFAGSSIPSLDYEDNDDEVLCTHSEIPRPVADDNYDVWAGSLPNSYNDAYYYQNPSTHSNIEMLYIFIPCGVALTFLIICGAVALYARHVQRQLILTEVIMRFS